MTVRWNGDSDMTITNPGGQPCNAPAVTTGSPAGTIITATCEYVGAIANTQYDLGVVQEANGASGEFFPYTVDFMVDGVTVPELSGEMQPVAAAVAVDVAEGSRNFRFTNDNMRNTVADTELAPVRRDMFLAFDLVTPANPVDQFALTTVGDLPLDITRIARVVCDDEANGMMFPDVRFVCPTFGDDEIGSAEYRFYLAVKATAAATAALADFHLDISSNGVVIPGGPVYIGGQDSAFLKTFLFRADSGDGPVILYDDDPPFLLKVTFEAPNPATDVVTTIAGATPAAANCDSSNDFRGTAGMTYNVIISCRDYVAGDYTFTVDTDTTAITGAVYEFFYDGVLQTALSGTGDIPLAAGTQTFTFTAPATRGDALITPMVNPGPLV